MAFFGTCCSSFVSINAGSGRDILTPEGFEALPKVRKANKLLARTVEMHGVLRGSVGSLL